MPYKSIDTHGSGPPAQYFEPDPATVEACAKAMKAERERLIAQPLASIWPQLAAAAIRSLVSGEPQNSAQPSPSHPVAGLTKKEQRLVDKAEVAPFVSSVEIDALVAIIRRLSSSPENVSEEELASALRFINGGGAWGYVARALLDKYSIRAISNMGK